MSVKSESGMDNSAANGDVIACGGRVTAATTRIGVDQHVCFHEPPTDSVEGGACGGAELSEMAGDCAAPARRWRVRVGTCSVSGSRVRNEDYCATDLERLAYAVSDGIGGAPYGDIMARIACNRALSAFAEGEGGGLSFGERMLEAIDLADNACSCVSEWLGGQGSGATLLLAAFEGSTLYVSSVGDSMCFRLRGGALEPLVSVGRASAVSNALDSALGYRMQLTLRTWKGDVREGDAYLLCTDGVWSTQSDESIAKGLMLHMGVPRDMAQAVVLASDMSDNATAMVLLPYPPLANETAERGVPMGYEPLAAASTE